MKKKTEKIKKTDGSILPCRLASYAHAHRRGVYEHTAIQARCRRGVVCRGSNEQKNTTTDALRKKAEKKQHRMRKNRKNTSLIDQTHSNRHRQSDNDNTSTTVHRHITRVTRCAVTAIGEKKIEEKKNKKRRARRTGAIVAFRQRKIITIRKLLFHIADNGIRTELQG
jgi:hypothetical protein